MERTNLGVEEILRPTTNVASGEPFFKAENGNEAPDDTMEASAAKPESFQVGRERMKAIGGFFSKMKEGLKSAAGKTSDKISNLWNRTKNVTAKSLGTATAATLMAPEAVVFGLKKTTEGMDYMLDKGSQFETWIGDKAVEGYDLAGDKIKRAASFTKAVHSSNMEDIKEAGQDIARGFNNAVEFGKNKIEAGKHKVAQVKEGWRTAINKFYVRRLESEIQKNKEKEAKYAEIKLKLQEKLATLSAVDNLEMAFI